jgi:hypothetical protein
MDIEETKIFKILNINLKLPKSFWIALSWSLSLAGLYFWLAYLLYSPAYKKFAVEWGLRFPSFFSEWGWFCGCACWAAFWKSNPIRKPASDISAETALIGFLSLLFLGTLTRFWNLNQLQGQYGLDQVMVFKHVENILAGNYLLLEDFGSRPPFGRFFVAMLCKCFSGLEIGTALRTANAFFDVCALAIFYWAGKFWVSRRTGLILMTLGLISRPMLYKGYWGIDYNLLSVLVPLALGATLRALQKPSLYRFISWGLAVALGIYVATAYRPWVPILVTGTGWVLWWRARARKASRGFGFCYVLVLTVVWFFVFCISHNFMFPRQALSPLSDKAIFIFILFAFLVWTIAWLRNRQPDTFQAQLGAWGAGALLALGLYGIVAVDQLFSPHVEILAFWKTKVFQANPCGIASIRINYLWDFVALNGGDYEAISDPSQPFFDLATGLAVLLGLLRVLVKPTLGSLALGFFGCLGLSPFVLSVSPHSGRLYGCLFPFYALAAMALEELWHRFRQDWQGKVVGFGGLAIVIVICASVLISNFEDVWTWMDTRNTESVMAQAAREASSEAHVYLVPSVSLQSQAVDQLVGNIKTIWWKPPYTKPKAVALSKNEICFLVPVENTEAQTALKKLYPSAVWSGKGSPKGDTAVKIWEITCRGPWSESESSEKTQVP